MTNKDAQGALDWINWKIKEAHKSGIERIPVYETIRQALEVNQELVEALKDLICASKSSGYPHEALKRSEQALAKAEAAGGD